MCSLPCVVQRNPQNSMKLMGYSQESGIHCRRTHLISCMLVVFLKLPCLRFRPIFFDNSFIPIALLWRGCEPASKGHHSEVLGTPKPLDLVISLITGDKALKPPPWKLLHQLRKNRCSVAPEYIIRPP